MRGSLGRVNMQRLFMNADLAAGTPVQATEAQAHYLGNVMRLAEGAAVALFNGRDGEFSARITRIGRGRATLLPETLLRPQEAGPDLWLAFAPLKRDATDLLVRQATELGVSVLIPVFTAHTNSARINPERLEAIAREAAEQCERLDVPTLRPAVKFYDLLANWPEERFLAAAIERGEPAPGPLEAGALLVGPEGGWSPLELDALRASRFVSAIGLGPRILRAETAAVAGLAVLQARTWQTK
jgi:16S rRNA (uracil1498-N3)-methyltransferase